MSVENINGFNHKNIVIKNISLHVVEKGDVLNPCIFFIHGWPTNWREFEKVMEILSKKFYTVAIDLPGIGESKGSLNSYAKENIADYILELINVLNLKNIILVGCDAGGQIVYSCIKNFQEKLSGAIIMNVVIPGVSPWNTIKNNPYIWHFRFHLINDLPENLVSGREEIYFSYFYDILSSKNNIISDTYKSYFVQAYSNIDALKSGFDLYRTFNIDEENNIQTKNISVEIPVLYLRGRQENVDINLYLKGFKENGFKNLYHEIIEDCGHSSALEQPEKVSEVIEKFEKLLNKI